VATLLDEKAIFQYYDGQRVRYGDPFAIWRALTQDPEINLDRIAPEDDSGHEPETSQFLSLLRRVFDVKPFDEASGAGLTDWQTLNLVGHLRAYTVQVKKNSRPGPTSPPNTDSVSSTGQEPQNEPTNACGDCTSTQDAPKPSVPTA